MNNPSITFYSGVGTVTGSNFLFEFENLRILVDCGLLQGDKFSEDQNAKPFPYDPSSIQYLFVTHAHMDHIGKIPKLVRDGFTGVIYSTPETKSLSEVMFPDALRLLQKEAEQRNTEVLYTEEDITHALSLWNVIPYHTKTEIIPGLSFYLKDAGHVLGSSMVEFSFKTSNESNEWRKLVFTGDLGNSPSPLLKDTEELTDANYLVMDSVYGDRNHEPLDERRSRLREIISDAIARGGTLVIPAFSLERSQVILYEINNLVEEGKISSVPVFLDSPLAIAVTDIYRKGTEHFNQTVQEEIKGGDNIFNFPKLKFSVSARDHDEIAKVANPKIIIAGSGMSVGGRVVSHERHYLSDPKSTLLLIGYQVAGSLGRAIQDGAKEIVIGGERIPVRATIERVSGYSAHKDSDHLIEFVEKTRDNLKEVFVVMGEPKSSLFLVQRLRDYVGVNAIFPEKGIKYELE
ncbi:MAG: MBL fold metallo-hydrolase [Candidatus Taylorbacteria bacterium]